MRDDEWLREGGERPLTRRGGMPGQAGGGEAGGGGGKGGGVERALDRLWSWDYE